MVKFVINGGQEGMFGVVVLKLSTGVGISQTQSCYKRQETQEEESGTDTENSEMKEKVNRRKVAVKEKRNKKK